MTKIMHLKAGKNTGKLKKFSVGYNQDIQMLGLVKIFRDYVKDIYFPMPKLLFGSGRVVEQDDSYLLEIPQIIKFCRQNMIEPVMTVNPTCEGEFTGTKRQTEKIINVLNANKGINSVILANPLHAAPLRKAFPKIRLIASVNCYIKNAESAEYYKKLGFDEVTINRDMNRDIPLIKEIQKLVKARILLNEGCLRNCPFRKTHFNMISHGHDSEYFDENTCVRILRREPEKFFSIPFVRPEDLHYYDFADTFKLATRTTPTEKLGYVLEAYASRRFDGDLLDLLSTRSLFGVFNRIDNSKLTEMNLWIKQQAL